MADFGQHPSETIAARHECFQYPLMPKVNRKFSKEQIPRILHIPRAARTEGTKVFMGFGREGELAFLIS
jgi:hypothetical protein